MRIVSLIFLCAFSVNCFAADDEKFTPLFNGKDLAGWKNVNVAPDTFTVKDGILVSTGKPTGTIRTVSARMGTGWTVSRGSTSSTTRLSFRSPTCKPPIITEWASHPREEWV